MLILKILLILLSFLKDLLMPVYCGRILRMLPSPASVTRWPYSLHLQLNYDPTDTP